MIAPAMQSSLQPENAILNLRGMLSVSSLCRNANASRRRIGLHVENLVVQQSAQRARRHVADRVVAGFARGQPDIGQHVQQRRGTCAQRHEVILHVLPGGEVAFAAARTRRRLRASCPICADVSSAAGNLGADHLDAGLALAVDAAAQAPGTEFVIGQSAGQDTGPPRRGILRYPDGRSGRIRLR